MTTMDDGADLPGRLEEALPKEAYLSDEAYRHEVDRIFRREWLCIGREETIPVPGDFLHVDAVDENVLVVRQRDGGLRAFANVCRHRGSLLVIDGPAWTPDREAPRAAGRFKGSIVCPYHAWTYGLDGGLRNAPFLDERHGLARSDLPLHAVGVDAWGGFVFVNLAAEQPAAPLAEQLGEIPERARRYPLAELRTAQRITYDVPANWKVIVENYNECYHCGPVHPELCEIVPAFKQGGAGLDWDRGIPMREGAWTYTFSGTTERRPFPGLSDEERERHKGELVYPNLMLSLSPDHAAAFTLWPLGPERTVITCDFLFHPDEIERPGFDPSDAVEFWDLVNRQDWRICGSVQRGMAQRRFTRGYYAPMEDLSLDIRRYLADRLGQV